MDSDLTVKIRLKHTDDGWFWDAYSYSHPHISGADDGEPTQAAALEAAYVWINQNLEQHGR